jgi:hypothetical protein
MLVTRGHTQIFMAQKLSHSVNIRTAHTQPGSVCVSEVMKPKIDDA